MSSIYANDGQASAYKSHMNARRRIEEIEDMRRAENCEILGVYLCGSDRLKKHMQYNKRGKFGG